MFGKHFTKITLVALTLGAFGCGRGDDGAPSDLQFDSAHSFALDGTINNGRLLATSSDEGRIKAEIYEQLMYTTGQLNGVGGVADMHSLESSIIQITPRTDGRFEVIYAAKLLVSWPREVQAPATYGLIVPAGGDWGLLGRFYQAYGADEHGAKRCLANEAHEVSQGILWYYYRPLKGSCALRDPSLDNQSIVSRFPIQFAVSTQNTQGKSPEYHKVWEDGRLVATAIFGKYEEGAMSDGDAGIAAYAQFYYDLLRSYGQPVSTSLPAGWRPSATNDQIFMKFNTVAGEMDIAIFLVDGIRNVDDDFKAKYNQRTQISDYVAYSGHSGLGANIRALARMGKFVQGQYQLFLVNGCDTFVYVDDALRDAHVAANPGTEDQKDKYLDVITNAMPSFFHSNSRSNLAVIDGLLGRQKTYRQILASFDVSQRAAVTGEQDNRFPAPFDQ
jgi:hypothetical protein